MSLLVAVKSCHRDRKAGFHQAIRETWGKDLPPSTTLRFFMGTNPDTREGTPLNKDEIVTFCEDDYMSLPFKTREIAKWMTGRLFTYVFLCDCDTIVKVKELLALPYQSLDYGGYFGKNENVRETFYYKDHLKEYPNCYPWASGGYGYFLSRQAAIEVADTFPDEWAEDLGVGQIVGPLVQKGWLNIDRLDMASAVWHFRKSRLYPQFTPDLLRRIYREGGPQNVYREAVHSDTSGTS